MSDLRAKFDHQMNKWAVQSELMYIRNTLELLAMIEHPFLRTPIKDMGLGESLLNHMKERGIDVQEPCGHNLLLRREMSVDRTTEFEHKFIENNFPLSEFMLLSGAYLKDNRTVSTVKYVEKLQSQNPEVKDVMALAATDLQRQIEELYAKREDRFRRLNIISIDIPESALTWHSEAELESMASQTLSRRFLLALEDTISSSDGDYKPPEPRQLNYRKPIKLEFAIHAAGVIDKERDTVIQRLTREIALSFAGTETTTEIIYSSPNLRDRAPGYADFRAPTIKAPEWLCIYAPYKGKLDLGI